MTCAIISNIYNMNLRIDNILKASSICLITKLQYVEASIPPIPIRRIRVYCLHNDQEVPPLPARDYHSLFAQLRIVMLNKYDYLGFLQTKRLLLLRARYLPSVQSGVFVSLSHAYLLVRAANLVSQPLPIRLVALNSVVM